MQLFLIHQPEDLTKDGTSYYHNLAECFYIEDATLIINHFISKKNTTNYGMKTWLLEAIVNSLADYVEYVNILLERN